MGTRAKMPLPWLRVRRMPHAFGLPDLAAASSVSRIHSELVCPSFWAAASISAASEAVTRQYKRPARDEPFGNGGLPILGFFGIGSKIFCVGTESH